MRVLIIISVLFLSACGSDRQAYSIPTPDFTAAPAQPLTASPSPKAIDNSDCAWSTAFTTSPTSPIDDSGILLCSFDDFTKQFAFYKNGTGLYQYENISSVLWDLDYHYSDTEYCTLEVVATFPGGSGKFAFYLKNPIINPVTHKLQSFDYIYFNNVTTVTNCH
jgi:hypothetical protein